MCLCCCGCYVGLLSGTDVPCKMQGGRRSPEDGVQEVQPHRPQQGLAAAPSPLPAGGLRPSPSERGALTSRALHPGQRILLRAGWRCQTHSSSAELERKP